MGHVVSVDTKTKHHMSGTPILRAIHRLELGKKSFFFISGMIISIPLTIYIQKFVNNLLLTSLRRIFYIRLCSTVIFAPFIEEFAKAYPLLYRHGDTKRSFFTLGLLVGLGFGVSEFFYYVLQRGATICSRLPCIFHHAATTSITAYGIKRNRPFWPYLIAVTLHSLNNLAGIYGLLFLISGYPILIATFLIAYYLHLKMSRALKQFSHIG